MYNLNDNVNSEGGSIKIFPLGITENVTLTDVITDTANNGNNYLKFVFAAEDGSEVSHFEWPLDSDDENFNSKLLNQTKRIKHILTKFIKKDFPQAKSFEDLCDKLVKLFANLKGYNKITLRLKTVYNYNNYVAIPKYVPFIERMSVSPTKLSITSFDKMEKDTADSPAAISNTNGQEVLATEKAEEETLPF
tara:strand:- start:12499 stop:13074 length:576 start_codon:yes stop_codon:yes gene_type:complete